MSKTKQNALWYKGTDTDIVAVASNLSRDGVPFEREGSELNDELVSLKQSLATALTERNNLKEIKFPLKPESYVGSTAGWAFGISGAVDVFLFVFHILIWILNLVFNISWDTWGWTKTAFIWGLCLSCAATLIALIKYGFDKNQYNIDLSLYYQYAQRRDELDATISETEVSIKSRSNDLDILHNVRNQALGYAIRTNLGIPFNDEHLSPSDYDVVKLKYFDLLDEKGRIGSSMSKVEQKLFIDKKLKFFYEESMKSEITDKSVFTEFVGQVKDSAKLKDTNVLRHDLVKTGSRGYSEIDRLPEYKRLLEDNTMEPYLRKMNAVHDRNTKKLLFITDVKKKADQTMDIRMLLSSARHEYDELMRVSDSVSYVLDFARGCAYRNIYLGVELLNYIRDNAGGSSLTTAQDNISISQVERMDISSLTQAELSSNAVEIAKSEFNRLSDLASVLDTNYAQKFVSENPKISAGIAAVEIATSAVAVIGEHISKVSMNEENQRQMLCEMTSITDNYTKGQGQMLRAIEIVEAIIGANKGFMAIYEPIREKVFEGNDMIGVSREDLVKLAFAMKEYKKISDAKIDS